MIGHLKNPSRGGRVVLSGGNGACGSVRDRAVEAEGIVFLFKLVDEEGLGGSLQPPLLLRVLQGEGKDLFVGGGHDVAQGGQHRGGDRHHGSASHAAVLSLGFLTELSVEVGLAISADEAAVEHLQIGVLGVGLFADVAGG